MGEKMVICMNIPGQGIHEDLEIPGNITTIDLIEALSSIYRLNINKDRLNDYYLKMEYPKGLLRGSQRLSESGMRDGSEVWLWNES